MQAGKIRHIKSGREYNQLFPAATKDTATIIHNAGLNDTISFIPKVVAQTLDQTKQISDHLKGATVYDTCRNIWHFVYQHINYRKDKDGYEQIRSPSRTWVDRQSGVDCDCYSTFISSILSNLAIPHKLRITKYKKGYFQHIYPVVPVGNGYIIIDCVTDQFNYEVPYTEKKDINMDLQYLSGLGDRGDDLVFDGDMGDLGAAKKKKKGLFKKILSKVNKLNPATILLRNGFLAAMKLNLFKVGSRIKYAYLSPEEAAKRGILPDKFQKLVKVKEKLESIFETAGGKVTNLKKAILKGKGNKNKEVALSGLGFADSDMSIMYMDRTTPLAQLLGPDMYYDENVQGMEGFQGFGELGEPITGAAIASATAAVAAIAKLLKSVGNIFGGKEKGSEDFDEGAIAAAEKTDTAAGASATTTTSSSAGSSEDLPVARSSTVTITNDESNVSTESDNTALLPAPSADDTMVVSSGTGAAAAPDSTETFWTKNKKWLLPAAIGIGGITIIAVGMKMMQPASKRGAVHGLNGTLKWKRKKTTKRKQKYTRKQSIGLL
jgi:hypothetical protein